MKTEANDAGRTSVLVLKGLKNDPSVSVKSIRPCSTLTLFRMVRLEPKEEQVIGLMSGVRSHHALALQTAGARAQEQVEVTSRLGSLIERLEQSLPSIEARLDSQERSLCALQTEVRHCGALIDGLVGSLRSLDARKEPRYAFDKAVRVLVGEEQAALSARVVNASDCGLGLVSGAPAPSDQPAEGEFVDYYELCRPCVRDHG